MVFYKVSRLTPAACNTLARCARPTTRTPFTFHSASITSLASRSCRQQRPSYQCLFARAAKQQKRSYGFNPYILQRNLAIARLVIRHRYFPYAAGGLLVIGGMFYVSHIEEAPVTHRRRFMIVSNADEAELGKQMYTQVMREHANKLLPPSHPYYKQVQRVARKLIPHSGLPDEQWELNVIEDPQTNAFVVPGGKIFVFTGMFDVCKSDDSLAAVLSHEIGHNIAHHSAERASKNMLTLLGVWAIDLLIGQDWGQDLALYLMFTLPGSRMQETEADHIGLLMMSEACYDPQAAVEMWATMEQLEKTGSIPEWMSTHPSNHNRQENIRGWLPEAEQKMEESQCAMTRPQATAFWNQAKAYS